MRIGEERNRAARRARDAAEVEGVVSGIIAMREPFGVIDNGGNGGGCGHPSTLPIGPADGKHARGSFWSAHAPRSKRSCYARGGGAPAYRYIPRLAQAAVDKNGHNPRGSTNGRPSQHYQPLRRNQNLEIT